jgi:hypothetical protein
MNTNIKAGRPNGFDTDADYKYIAKRLLPIYDVLENTDYEKRVAGLKRAAKTDELTPKQKSGIEKSLYMANVIDKRNRDLILNGLRNSRHRRNGKITSITVSRETKTRLEKLKRKYALNSIDEVISAMVVDKDKIAEFEF